MPVITKNVHIKAPVSKVFSFVTAPENWTKFVTSLVNVRDHSSEKAEKGMTFKWTYRMLGVNFHGPGEVAELVKNKRFSMKMEGPHPIRENYLFNTVDDGTELSVEIEYDIPGKIMSAVSKTGLIEKLNKKEAENVLNKIKMFCEEQE